MTNVQKILKVKVWYKMVHTNCKSVRKIEAPTIYIPILLLLPVLGGEFSVLSKAWMHRRNWLLKRNDCKGGAIYMSNRIGTTWHPQAPTMRSSRKQMFVPVARMTPCPQPLICWGVLSTHWLQDAAACCRCCASIGRSACANLCNTSSPDSFQQLN